ncbi:hypothetical protein ACIA8K_20955 [Catenuloplanes sp. NPDC051500]|uniref:hypothetical protein n=1 Tax=Catenuloplanes sp. NPDC051500 TaxID=3363959 RepID=UPI0037A8FD61
MAFWRRGGQGTKGQYDEVVVLGRQVITSAYPSELELFDDVAAELRRGRPLVTRAAREADLGVVSSVLLSVLSYLSAAAVTGSTEWAVATIGDAGERRLAALLTRQRPAVALEPEEESAVYAEVVAAAERNGLTRSRGETMAAAVIEALRLRGRE